MTELIEAGYVYIAQPPLYKLKVGSDDRYFEKELQLEEWLMRERLDKIEITDRDGDEVRPDRVAAPAAAARGQGVRGLGVQAQGAVRRRRRSSYVKDHRLIEHADRDAWPTSRPTSRRRCPTTSPTASR